MRLGMSNGQIVYCRSKLARLTAIKHQTTEAADAAIDSLFRAYQYSVQTGSNRWQFAVELDELLRLGLTRSDLRWLVVTGVVLHRRELIQASCEAHKLADFGEQPFLSSSCFVLSDDGLSMIAQQKGRKPVRNICLTIPSTNSNVPSLVGGANDTPQWNAERRELRLHSLLIKHFRGPAANQEWIIRAFQEEQWAVRIDDPLPPLAEKDSRRRLNDAIKNLNRHQAHPLISFHGDGTGRGVRWELNDAGAAMLSSDLP